MSSKNSIRGSRNTTRGSNIFLIGNDNTITGETINAIGVVNTNLGSGFNINAFSVNNANILSGTNITLVGVKDTTIYSGDNIVALGISGGTLTGSNTTYVQNLTILSSITVNNTVYSGNPFTTYWINGVGAYSLTNTYNSSAANTTTGLMSFAIGSGNTASNVYSYAEGNNTFSIGLSSHAEGTSTSAITSYCHAEGFQTFASGNTSHAEGTSTKTYAGASHAEGDNTSAYGYASHAEGSNTISSGASSHSEGVFTIAVDIGAHSEGSGTTAIGLCAHAEGGNTYALENCAHAGGAFAKATRYAEWTRSSDIPYGSTPEYPQYGKLSAGGTTNAVAAVQFYLDNNGNNNQFKIETDSAFYVQLKAVVQDDNNGDSAAFTGEGLIKNVGGTVSLVGAFVMNQTFADATLLATTMTITADNVNKALKIEGSGIGGSTLNWFVEATYQKVVY